MIKLEINTVREFESESDIIDYMSQMVLEGKIHLDVATNILQHGSAIMADNSGPYEHVATTYKVTKGGTE